MTQATICSLFLAIAACFTPSNVLANEPPRTPNILWIVAENMAPDIGCYGTPLVKTPRVDQLAAQGMRYEWAFDTCPVCSPSRSAFMTGMYQTTIDAHNHRSHRHDHHPLPNGVQPFTQRLHEIGYYTANVKRIGEDQVGTGKSEINFDVNGPVLNKTVRLPETSDRSNPDHHNRMNETRLFHSNDWSDLLPNQPFYAQINLPVVELTAEGWHSSKDSPRYQFGHPAVVNPNDVTPPPYYPNHPLVRKEWAGYLDSVCGMDTRVGRILDQLDQDGLADDTVVVFFADNGRLALRGLDWCYDSGDRVPLIIRWPKNFSPPTGFKVGSVNQQLVSLIDVTATTLNIAGIKKPANMHGRVLFGAHADAAREFVINARDRTDDAVNRIRSVRTHRYRYTRNFMPEMAFMALHRYKYARIPIVRLMYQLHQKGELTLAQQQLMAPRLPDEELYDIRKDPFEIANLATSTTPEHQRALKELRGKLKTWIEDTGDLGQQPESQTDIDIWVKDAAQKHGTPDWYNPLFGTSNLVVPTDE